MPLTRLALAWAQEHQLQQEKGRKFEAEEWRASTTDPDARHRKMADGGTRAATTCGSPPRRQRMGTPEAQALYHMRGQTAEWCRAKVLAVALLHNLLRAASLRRRSERRRRTRKLADAWRCLGERNKGIAKREA